MTEQLTPRDPADESEMASTMLPYAAYFDARIAIQHLLDVDPKGWENLLVAIRRIARTREATVIEAELENCRAALTRSATQQDIANQWTDHADAMDRIRDYNATHNEQGELV